VEVPQRLGIVPAVVEQERVEPDAALGVQFSAEGLNDRERSGFVVFTEVPDVVPRVVMQERPVRMRPLTLDVFEEAPAQLVAKWRSHPDHRRAGERRAGPERQLAHEGATHPRSCYAAIGERVLEAEEESAGHDRRPTHAPRDNRARQLEVEQPNFPDGHLRLGAPDRDLLTEVVRVVAQNGTPGGAQAARRISELDGDLPAALPLGESGRARSSGEPLDSRRPLHPKSGAAEPGAVWKREGERVGRERQRPAAELVHYADRPERAVRHGPGGGEGVVAERQVGAIAAAPRFTEQAGNGHPGAEGGRAADELTPGEDAHGAGHLSEGLSL